MKLRIVGLKSGVVYFFIFSFSLVTFSGCDYLGFLKPKTASEVKVSGQVAVKGPIVAKVNNLPIGLEDLTQEIDSYNAMVPSDKPEMKYDTREKKIEYLKNELVRRMLLYQAALNMGLDKNEDVVRALQKTKMDLLVVALVKQEAEKIDVNSKDIEDYYNTYKEQLKEPEEREVREIVVPTMQEANDILVQLLQGADFATLAKDRSKSASAKNGGDLGFLERGKSFKEMESIVDNLDAGQVSNVFKGAEGYYIVKLEAKRGGKQRTLSEMWDDIKRALTFIKQQQRIEEIIGKLSREAKIEIFEGEVK